VKSYIDFKESAVEWVGDIPAHWSIKNLKYISNVRASNVDKHLFDTEKRVYLCNYTDVYYNEYIDKTTPLKIGSCTEDEYIKFKVKKGDVIITKDSESPDDIGIPCLIKEDLVDTVCGYHLSIITSDPTQIDGNYLFRQFQTERIQQHYEINSFGITRYGLGKAIIENTNLILPPLPEQQQIVTYLDEKTAIIDDLILKKQRKIELLKEQRTSIINQAVTKGLDANVKMKDSGVEWIGEIPEHWVLQRISTLGRFSKGGGIKRDEIQTSGLPCIRYGEIYTTYDRIVTTPVSFIAEESSHQCEPIEMGAVLFTGSGETMEDIGKTVVYMGNETVYVGGDIIVLKLLDTYAPSFISYLMNCHYVVYQKSLSGRGEIVVHIYAKQLKDIQIAIPPIVEQQNIADFLDEKTQTIDAQIVLENQKIGLLKEYRQSLISEVVTGKIDVRIN